MRKGIDIRSGWRYAVSQYPEGAEISTNPWVPTTSLSIWDGMTEIPAHGEWENVNLPHIWNKDCATQAGPRLYEKELVLQRPGEDNRYYIAFGGVFGLARVFVNGKYAFEHRGGYTRFCVDLTPYAVDGKNLVTVFTDNTIFVEINPISGDFAKYGGIYRETELIQVGKAHFDLMYCGCPGVVVDTQADGTTRVRPRICGTDSAVVRYTVTDAEGKLAANAESAEADFTFRVENPILWNGKQNPYCYTLTAELTDGESVVDTVSMTIGYRDIRMTADKGFFLNGEHVVICGVAKHQDRAGCGPAQSDAELENDMEIIKEVGANAVRLSHYQHPQHFYDLCDKEGMLVWAEIPMLCMPDDNDAIIDNAKYQLAELLMQNRHHPSIVMWGVQNEVALMGQTEQQPRKVQALHDWVKFLKPDALTASANEYTVKPERPLNSISDIQGYNLYYGWYYGEFDELADFFDDYHAKRPENPIGISEYGVDARLDLHKQVPEKQDYSEEYQCAFHEAAYPIIRAREYVWGSFIWNMFDFSSPYRSFQPLLGLNRKGLVTFDRQNRKDVFYYYQAWWSEKPMLYLCERRYEKRVEDTAVIKVYSNQKEVALTVNGECIGTLTGDKVFRFENVKLMDGANTITAVSGNLTDTMVIQKVSTPEESYIFVDPRTGGSARDWVKRKDEKK